MPIYTGFITLADIFDGTPTYNAFISNENQTFTANADNSITQSNFVFSTTVNVYFGGTTLSYASTNPNQSQWAMTSDGINFGSSAIVQSPANAGLVFTVDANGTINLNAAASVSGNFANNTGLVQSATATVPIRVQNTLGNYIQLNRVLTLSKAVGGSAQFSVITTSTQVVSYAYGSNVPKEPASIITFWASSPNITSGVFTWQYFSGNPSITSVFTTIDPANPPAGITFGASPYETMNVTYAAYNTLLGNINSQVVFLVYRGNSSINDQVSVIKLVDAQPGASAVTVQVVSSQATVFKNNTGSTTLTANLYTGGTLTPPNYTLLSNVISLSSNQVTVLGDRRNALPTGLGINFLTGGTTVANNNTVSTTALTGSNTIVTLGAPSTGIGVGTRQVFTLTFTGTSTAAGIVTVTINNIPIQTQNINSGTSGSSVASTVALLNLPFDGVYNCTSTLSTNVVTATAPYGASNVTVVVSAPAGITALAATTVTGVPNTALYLPTFTYQWSKSGTAIPNAIANTLAVSATDIPDNGASLFSCAVTTP